VNTAPAAKATGLSFTLPEDAVPAGIFCRERNAKIKRDF